MKQLFLFSLLGIFFYSCDKGTILGGETEVTSYGTISEYTENKSLNILTDDNKKFLVENIDEIKDIYTKELHEGDRIWFGGIQRFAEKVNGVRIYNLDIVELSVATTSSDVLYKSTLTQQNIDNFRDIPLVVFGNLTEKRCNIQYYCNYKENTQPEISFVIDDTDSNYMKVSETGELVLNVRVYTNVTGTYNSNVVYGVPLIYTSFPVEQYTKIDGIEKFILNLTSHEITETGSAITTKSLTWYKLL